MLRYGRGYKKRQSQNTYQRRRLDNCYNPIFDKVCKLCKNDRNACKDDSLIEIATMKALLNMSNIFDENTIEMPY